MNESNEDPHEPMQLSDDLKRFQAELARLSPREDRLNRERLMFLAGQASLVAMGKREPVLGINLQSSVWPAAFAAMTGVAALLLVMVISKPESAALPSLPAAEFARNDSPQIWSRGADERTVLSTIDAHLGDVDTLLAREDFVNSGADTASTPDESRGARLLTPGRWHEVLNESESAGPSPRGALNYPLNRGATS